MRAERAWLAVGLAAATLLTGQAHAAPGGRVTIVNADPAGSGLNDGTPVPASGGNAGTTLGAQRRNALDEAARLWAARLPGTANVRVRASFVPLDCAADWAVFGGAGALEQFRDFTGAPRAGTWYSAALAGALSGADPNPAEDDIVARFTSSLDDGSCAFPSRWSYGFDGKPPEGHVDFVTVAVHELAHGLGFQTYVDLPSGRKLMGRDDAFLLNLRDSTTGKGWAEMADAERAASAVHPDRLVWAGSSGMQSARALASGVDVDGRLVMYAPAALQSGSSVTHLTEQLGGADVMVPFYREPTHAMELASAVLRDVGWSLTAGAAPELARWIVPASARAAGTNGAFYTTDLTLANRGAAPASFTLQFAGHDVDGRLGPASSFTLAAGKSVTYADVLSSVFGLSTGWGAISVTSSSPALVVSAQTSTPAAGGGTFGQSVPAAGAGDLVTSVAPRAIVSVREDGTARTNLVIANAREVPVEVTLRLASRDGVHLGSWSATLAPLEMRQLSSVARMLGVQAAVSDAWLVLSTPTEGGAFAAYASCIDNRTNDPRTLLAR